jgi:2-dehydropantoate 2-reductase
MRIAMFGAGGVGGYFGARLAQAGEEVTFIARGEHLRAIQSRGLRVETSGDGILIHPARASDDPRGAGTVDVVLLAVKSWQVREAAEAARPLLGPETFVVPLQNGVEAAAQLVSALGADRVLGGLCGTLSWVAEPGVIRSIGAVHFVRFGELDGRTSARAERLREAFDRAGVKVDIPADIHRALWEKFLFVVPLGGVGAVTRLPVGIVRTVPESRRLLQRAMEEIAAIARARGLPLDDATIARTLAFTDGLSPDGTTSLQRDIVAGRPSELDAWTGAVVRLGRESGVPTPVHDVLYDCLLPQDKQARGEI